MSEYGLLAVAEVQRSLADGGSLHALVNVVSDGESEADLNAGPAHPGEEPT
jgi:hypothetical protein